MDEWRSHHFRLRLGQNGRPRWWLDLLLLDTVVRDSLTGHSQSPEVLWRFHRRFSTDEVGHQFSLFYYGVPSDQTRLALAIGAHPALSVLRDGGLLRKYVSVSRGRAIEATSDLSWPPELRQSWPHYMHGVSEMMLDLAGSLAAAPRPAMQVAELPALEDYYSELMLQMNCTWHDHGSHAFLHHINALFGYSSVAATVRFHDETGVVF